MAMMNSVITPDSAFWTRNKHPAATDRYEMMPTCEIVDLCGEHEFDVVSYQEQRIRKNVEARKPYIKHLVRLRKVGQELVLNEVFPEVVIINGHNFTTRLQFMIGFFRMVCSNGMITGDIIDDFGSIRHTTKNPFQGILEKIHNGFDSGLRKLDTITAMKNRQLSWDEENEFVIQAGSLVPNRVYDNVHDLNYINRPEDVGRNLWLAFNRVQENLMRGNATLRSSNNRTRKARAIKALDTTVDVNRKLWTLAESYLEVA